MELNHGSEEHMKILQGRVKVLWVHGSNEPNYKLIVTVVSRGDSCRRKGRHPCLKFGLVEWLIVIVSLLMTALLMDFLYSLSLFYSDDPLLCISEDLMCDGIRHCPNGGGMFSDEDDQLCRKHRIDDHDIRNVSLINASFHLTLTHLLPRSIEPAKVINLAASDVGHLPKHFRSDRVDLSDIVDESAPRPSGL
jgi:hypothetical protein